MILIHRIIVERYSGISAQFPIRLTFAVTMASKTPDFNPTRDYYSVLGLNQDASQEQLKQARSKLAFKYHPDTNKAPDSPAKFREVQEAYDVLSDPRVRFQYDIAANAAGKGRNSINYSSGVGRDDVNSEYTAAMFRKRYEESVSSRPTGSNFGSRKFKHSPNGTGAAEVGQSLSTEELRKLRRMRPTVDMSGMGILLGGLAFAGVAAVGYALVQRSRMRNSVDDFNQHIRSQIKK